MSRAAAARLTRARARLCALGSLTLGLGLRLGGLGLALALDVALGGPAPALAAAPLSWSVPAVIDAHALTGVSCASESLCVAVDSKGGALVSSDPRAPGAVWTRAQIDGEQSLSAVSCAPEGLCAAVDDAGYALISSSAAHVFSRVLIDEHARALTSVSCASRSLCAAVDAAGSVLVSVDPESSTAPWTEVAHAEALRSVACADGRCVAAGGGVAAASSEPARAATWTTRAIDPALSISAISCAPLETCVAVDRSASVLASADPTTGASTWSSTAIAAFGEFDGVSCASSGLCLAVGSQGEALASDDPATPAPSWNSYLPDAGSAISGVSCLPGGLCVAVDSAGRALTARVPAPTVATGAPSALGTESATLTGTVNANDAALTACAFEYGASTSYGLAAPCSSPPAPAAGTQSAGATLTGLRPNTTYHYRLAATSPSGASAGADASFTTAISSTIAVVHPHPSISGTPAGGERLSCSSGTTPEVGVRLSYQWLRDLLPIPGASSASYTVKGSDSARHLQCQVTATNGGGSATATSGFVTVPPDIPPAASGETRVARASFGRGRVSVAVVCALRAPSGCHIALRLTAAQTVRHRRATLTLASASAHLAAAQRRTLTLALSKRARALLAARHTLQALLSVTGTVVGVIEAPLSLQAITLTRSARRARAAPAGAAELGAFNRARLATANASPAAARPPNILSPTPYMGWDTYFAFGGTYDETTVLEQASQLVRLGLEREGYRYVWLDVGWWQGARERDGQIAVSHAQWPHGLAWLTSTLHAAGLFVGLYTDAGPNGCGGGGQGSYGHYQQDVDTFAAWGFDAVKVDFCGGAELHLVPASAYAAYHAAIAHDSPRRPLLLNVCNFLQPGQYAEGQPTLSESAFASYSFGPEVANSWRTDTDVGLPGNVRFADVLRNMDADAAQPQAAGPGHWNDPDYLGADQGLSAAQFRTQFSMWSMLAAPLMISDDLTRISPASLQTVSRAGVIAIDQDPAGLQGALLSASGAGQVWAKALAGGAVAVALLNRSSASRVISTSAAALALGGASRYTLLDEWSGARTTTRGPISAHVPAQSTVLLSVSAG